MAIKSVALNMSLTPGGNVALGEQILGKVVESVKTRWLVGSLVASALALQDSALFAVFCPKGVRVFSSTGEDAAADILQEIENIISGQFMDSLPSDSCKLTFSPGTGTSLRSRAVVNDEGGEAILSHTAPVSDALGIGLSAAILVPPAPVYTASSLLNKIDSYFQDQDVPVDYLAVIDQYTGKVRVFSHESNLNLDAALSEVDQISIPGASMLAAYDLSVPTSDSEPPAVLTGPMWG